MALVYLALALIFVGAESYPLAHYLIKNKQIFYKMGPILSQEEKGQIQKCIKEMESKSCLRWKELTEGETWPVDAWAVFEKAWGKNTQCGVDLRPKGATKIRLTPECFNGKYVLLEMMKALGFSNEHQRPDRDCYVKVDDELVTHPLYEIIPTLDISFPYHTHSVMHFRKFDKLQPADGVPQREEFGSKDELTEVDAIKLNFEFCDGPHYCEMYRELCKNTVRRNREKGCVRTDKHDI